MSINLNTVNDRMSKNLYIRYRESFELSKWFQSTSDLQFAIKSIKKTMKHYCIMNINTLSR